MKKRTLQLLTISILMTGLIGCGGVSQKDYDTLKAENENLKKEIEALKFGPDKLLSQAKVYIESKDFYKAQTELQSLLDKHPASQQAIEGKQLLAVANNGIKEQEIADAKANAEREVEIDKREVSKKNAPAPEAVQKSGNKEYDKIRAEYKLFGKWDLKVPYFTGSLRLEIYQKGNKYLSVEPGVDYRIRQLRKRGQIFTIIGSKEGEYYLISSNRRMTLYDSLGELTDWEATLVE